MSDDDRRAPPPRWDPGPPEAVITRYGLLYAINIHEGITALREPYWRLGRRWAERCAQRKLARWNRQRPTWTVKP